MKKLSDYKDEDAIDLWADLTDPLCKIIADQEIRMILGRYGKDYIRISREILKRHKAEAIEIMLRIDDTPIDGLNVVIRLIELLNDLEQHPQIASFFGFAGQEQTDSASSGLPMESTEGAEN